MTATNINEVIEQLEHIITTCENTHNRMGYFAALYKKVTIAVRDKINEGFFDDNARMEKLDVVFANRYLLAHQQYLNKQSCSASWKVAFDLCQNWQPLVLQHLFVGMNAHIGLDLGIAAATVAPGIAIQTLHNDFNKINSVLSSLVETVENDIASFWPLLKPIDAVAGKLEEAMASFSMEIARDAAWKVALDYAPLQTQQQQQNFISTRDGKVAAFGEKIAYPGLLTKSLIILLRLGETGTVTSKIKSLNK